jgi:hypothetical protein
MKTKEILLLTGFILSLTLTGCIILPGRHHTTVVAPVPVVVPAPPPPVIVEPRP